MWLMVVLGCRGVEAEAPAISEAERSCRARDDANGCFTAAWERYHRGDSEASALFERACALGHGMGCKNRGVIARDALLGQPRDLAVAADFFERGCDAGEPESCHQRGALLVAEDSRDLCGSPAIDWYRRAAALDNDVGMARVAAWEADCPGGDKAAARALDERACARGYGSPCEHLALLWKQGLGGPASDEEWLRWLGRSCAAERPDAEGCYLLGSALYTRGELDAGPASLAALQKGCAGGHAVSCRNVGALLEEGWHGVAFDPDGANAAYAKACAAGDAESCGRKCD